MGADDILEGVAKFIDVIEGWVPFVIDVAGVKQDLEWGLATVKLMVEEKRGPTDDEWAEVNRRTEAMQTDLHTD